MSPDREMQDMKDFFTGLLTGLLGGLGAATALVITSWTIWILVRLLCN
jgi:hypothetical protein